MQKITEICRSKSHFSITKKPVTSIYGFWYQSRVHLNPNLIGLDILQEIHFEFLQPSYKLCSNFAVLHPEDRLKQMYIRGHSIST